MACASSMCFMTSGDHSSPLPTSGTSSSWLWEAWWLQDSITPYRPIMVSRFWYLWCRCVSVCLSSSLTPPSLTPASLLSLIFLPLLFSPSRLLPYSFHIFLPFPPPSPIPNLSFTVSSSSSPPPSLPGSKEILP